MAQIQTTCDVTNGSAVLQLPSGTDLSTASVSDLVYISNDGVPYYIASIDDINDTVTLSAPYAGATASTGSGTGTSLVIHNSYTTDQIPYPEQGDIRNISVIKSSIIKVQEELTKNNNKLLLDSVDQILSSSAIIDLKFYDTTQDTDGGAWRFLRNSWYSEATPSGKFLGRFADEAAARAAGGSANDWYARTGSTDFYRLDSSGETQIYRAGRKEFPKFSLILAESDRVVIYDVATSKPSMWREFATINSISWLYDINVGTDSITSIDIKQGVLCIGNGGSGIGYATLIDFPKDFGHMARTTNHEQWVRPISYSNSDVTRISYSDQYISNRNVNDVAITVLDNAPLDTATGLKVPTIVIATADQGSIIKSDASIVTIATISGEGILSVDIVDGRIQTGTAWDHSKYFDINDGSLLFYKSLAPAGVTIPQLIAGSQINAIADNTIASDIGLNILSIDEDDDTDSLVAYITTAYNTGWMPGDVRACLLSDSVTGSISTGIGNITDRSVKGNNADVVGTLSRTLIDSNGELVGYSGFSTANYIQQPYTSDLDFGTGNFWIGCWVDEGANSSEEVIAMRGYYDGSAWSGSAIYLAIGAAGNFYSAITDDGWLTRDSITSSLTVDDGIPHFVELRREGSALTISIDGQDAGSTTITNAAGSLTNANATLRFGINQSGTTTPLNGSIALFRASATVPTAEQRKHMYETERLMITNKCLIDGNSDSITTLEYNEKRKVLHAGTSWGRSDFNNLRRVDSEATGVGSLTAIAADGELMFNGGASGSDAYLPAIDLREELIGRALETVEDTEWKDLELLNGWVNYGSGFQTAQYRKVGDKVECRGLIKSGTTTAGTAIATIGSVFSPVNRGVHTLVTSDGSGGSVLARIDSYANGKLSIQSLTVSNDWLSLDGIEYSLS